MNADLSVITLIQHASLLVQLVMLLLLALSFFSWTFIFQRAAFLRSKNKRNRAFEAQFLSGNDMRKLYDASQTRKGDTDGLERIFRVGFKEFARLQQKDNGNPKSVIEGVERAMRVSIAEEQMKLEKHLGFLATVGSISPYIGLFGTVWGIMHAFQSLSNMQQATLAMVAPGISEALIATAMGLFAAIPAVIAFNRYTLTVQTMLNRYDTFIDEFSTVIHRRLYSSPGNTGGSHG